MEDANHIDTNNKSVVMICVIPLDLEKQTSPPILAWCIWSFQIMLSTSICILGDVEKSVITLLIII